MIHCIKKPIESSTSNISNEVEFYSIGFKMWVFFFKKKTQP